MYDRYRMEWTRLFDVKVMSVWLRKGNRKVQQKLGVSRAGQKGCSNRADAIPAALNLSCSVLWWKLHRLQFLHHVAGASCITILDIQRTLKFRLVKGFSDLDRKD